MQRVIKEPFSALSHLFGVILSIIGLITLLELSGNSDRALVASAIYGASLILLFLASTLVHGLHCSPKLAERFEQFDYAAIFLLIAGTYTPVCLLIVRGAFGWALMGVEWLLALIGMATVFFGGERCKRTYVAIYLAMGWLFLVALGPIWAGFSNELLAWLFGGGLFFSVGALIFFHDWPHLYQGRFSAHDLWHVFVLGGTMCHFEMISSCVQRHTALFS